MTRDELFENIVKKKSFLCIGLDPDISRIPAFLLSSDDPILEFNKKIIDATSQYCVAFKLNIAFYECLGSKGWESMKKTLDYIPENIFIIADGKRGDIGNTSKLYAKTFFETLDFDAATVAPYMGKDSVMPFLNFKNKWTILLALTSNEGRHDFQFLKEAGQFLFEHVVKKANSWGTPDNLMFVAGASQPEILQNIRKIAPHNFLLVPGYGAQGGDLKKVSQYGMNKQCGILVSSSRNIIYADSGKNFADNSRQAALKVQEEMKEFLNVYAGIA